MIPVRFAIVSTPNPVATPTGSRLWRAAIRYPQVVVALLWSMACARHPVPIEPAPAPGSTPATAVATSPVPPVSRDADRTNEFLASKSLMVPVEGMTPERVSDTYNARRTGGAHRALDIMAPRGTPVLSADAGRVFKLRSNPNGGITVYAIDSDQRFIYYYAHLARYRDGLKEGMPLEAGDVIGYVGTTGNAPPNVPHLHFQIMQYRPDKYWDGDPVNPFAYLTRSGKRRE